MNTLVEFAKYYKDELLHTVLPFWQQHSYDSELGGFYSYLDRRGRRLSSDKGGWVQGRGVWLFSYIYEHFQKNPDWLKIASHSAEFIWHSMRQENDRIPFLATAQGDCIRMRRYLFSEMFAITGFVQLARLPGMSGWLQPAYELLDMVHTNEEHMPPKVNPAVQKSIGHSTCMMMIHVYQVMRDVDPATAPMLNAKIDERIQILLGSLYQDEFGIILESVCADGSLLQEPEGLTINPGHVIETAWFLLLEASKRNKQDLQEKALNLIDKSLSIGWDNEYGGIFSFQNARGGQAPQVEWDMKYWWPHCEAIYACLLAYTSSKQQKYWDWFLKLHNYTWSHFPDRENGEWFGYLHRDGSLSMDFKGNHWKGPYHLPRMLAFVAQLAGNQDLPY